MVFSEFGRRVSENKSGGTDHGTAAPMFLVGDSIKAEISNIDSMDRRVTMTMRNPGESPAAEQLNALNREKAGQGATLGDLLKEKLGDKLSTLTGDKKEE